MSIQTIHLPAIVICLLLLTCKVVNADNRDLNENTRRYLQSIAQYEEIDDPENAIDSDGDYLSNWLENRIGSDSFDANSTRSETAGGDLTQFERTYINQGTNKMISPEAAVRFLKQASIGVSLDQITSVQVLGYEGWIDAQLNETPSLTEPYIESLSKRFESDRNTKNADLPYHKVNMENTNIGYLNSSTAWMRAVLRGDDYLRQRVAWALSQIFVVSDKTNPLTEAVCNFYDQLIINAFENYGVLLKKVTWHPVMGRYLSHLGNRKGNPSVNRLPDENFAREVMQLFTIGLWELNEDGTHKKDHSNNSIESYSNIDVQEMARVFTGFWLADVRFGKIVWSRYDKPMIINLYEHDFSEKSILNGLIKIRAGLKPELEVKNVLQALVDHPNTAPFVTTRLIQHLVSSNPSPEYVARVVREWHHSKGNLGSVVKAILLDREARNAAALARPDAGRLNDPLLRTMMIIRGFLHGRTSEVQPDSYPGIQWWSPEPINSINIEPFRAPSVFNFFEPDYELQDSHSDSQKKAPEFQLLNDVSAISVPNYLWDGINNGFHRRKNQPGKESLKLDFEHELKLLEKAQDLLLDHLNLLLSAGLMKPSTRIKIKRIINKVKTPLEKVKVAILATAISAESAISK